RLQPFRKLDLVDGVEARHGEVVAGDVDEGGPLRVERCADRGHDPPYLARLIVDGDDLTGAEDGVRRLLGWHEHVEGGVEDLDPQARWQVIPRKRGVRGQQGLEAHGYVPRRGKLIPLDAVPACQRNTPPVGIEAGAVTVHPHHGLRFRRQLSPRTDGLAVADRSGRSRLRRAPQPERVNEVRVHYPGDEHPTDVGAAQGGQDEEGNRENGNRRLDANLAKGPARVRRVWHVSRPPPL